MMNQRVYEVTLADGKTYKVDRLTAKKQLELQEIQEYITNGIQREITELQGSVFELDANGNIVKEKPGVDVTEVNKKVRGKYKERVLKMASLCLEGLKKNHPELTEDALTDIADLDDFMEMMTWMFGGRPAMRSFQRELVS